jgi:hypothetical protein
VTQLCNSFATAKSITNAHHQNPHTPTKMSSFYHREKKKRIEVHKFWQQKCPLFLRETKRKETEAFKFGNKNSDLFVDTKNY